MKNQLHFSIFLFVLAIALYFILPKKPIMIGINGAILIAIIRIRRYHLNN